MKNGSKILIAAAAGLAAGALIGVLLAPEGGKETRKKIVDTGKDIVDGAKNKVFSTKNKIVEFKDDLLKKAEQPV
jgi:gas vesicle protein